jgi:RNA polymerase sigma-70 factor (ECF subfamily)
LARLDLIESTLKGAAERWRWLQIGAAAFEAHLLRLGVTDASIGSYGADLALAFACSRGTSNAIDEIEKELHRQSAAARKRFALDDDAFGEVLQAVRMKLLSAPTPRIASYAGTGPLGAWLRMVVVRAAFDHVRRHMAEEELPLERLANSTLAPDEALEGARQVPRLHESLEATLSALSVDDRMLLKLHYLDGVSLDRLSAIMQLHRATVARRIATLRRQVVAEVGRRLGSRFGTHPSEFRSMWRTFGRHLQVTLSRVLAD